MHQPAVLYVLCLVTTHLAAQEQIAGEWRGHWFRSGDSLEVTLHVTRDSATGELAATFDSKRLRVLGIPFSEVRNEGCCDVLMRLQGDRTTAIFTGTVRGDTFAGKLREGELGGRFAYVRVPAVHRPRFLEREARFQNGSVTLAGTLILPAGGSRRPAVVFVHGSGAEGRWASRFLATTFAENGVAALIFDKRGVGESSGDWRTASLDDLAGDVAAAVAWVRKRAEIDPARVGIYGHSQGGTLAPMIYARSKEISFIIASAAGGIPTDSLEIFSILNSVYPDASSRLDSADARAYTAELVAVAYHGRPRLRFDSLVSQFQGRRWFFAPPPPSSGYWSFSRLWMQFQPLVWWRQVRVPVLLLYGSDDMRVPAQESAARIAGALLRGAQNADVTVRVFPGADHTFRLRPGPSGWPDTAADYLPTLVGWLSARF